MNNTSVSTTYIALFRVGSRQVEFASNYPLPITDGDLVVVAGREYQGTLYADAIRNATTGVTRHGGIYGRICAACIVLIIGLTAGYFLAKNIGLAWAGMSFVFVVGAAFLCWRAAQTSNALHYVKSASP